MRSTTLTWISTDEERRKVTQILLLGTVVIVVVILFFCTCKLYPYVEKGEMNMLSFIGFIIALIAIVGCLNFFYVLRSQYVKR
jgi:purine-cytosine permease-like protein